MKYNDFLELWLEKYKKPEIKTTTYVLYKLYIEKFISPELGEYELDNLTKSVLIDFINKQKIDKSTSTINGLITIIKLSIRCANDLDYTTTNSTDILHRATKKSTAPKILTKNEAVKLTKYLIDYNCVNLGKNKHSIGILLALYTGIRIGELMALKKSDIDLKNQKITINKTLVQVCLNGKFQTFINSPKTETSMRIVPIPKIIVPHLKKYLENSTGEYFLSTRKGNFVDRRSMERIFTNTIKRLNLTPITFHGLRHTFATNLIESGVDPKTVSEILGHSNPLTTLRIYCHPSNLAKITASNKWANAIFAKLT